MAETREDDSTLLRPTISCIHMASSPLRGACDPIVREAAASIATRTRRARAGGFHPEESAGDPEWIARATSDDHAQRHDDLRTRARAVRRPARPRPARRLPHLIAPFGPWLHPRFHGHRAGSPLTAVTQGSRTDLTFPELSSHATRAPRHRPAVRRAGIHPGASGARGAWALRVGAHAGKSALARRVHPTPLSSPTSDRLHSPSRVTGRCQTLERWARG